VISRRSGSQRLSQTACLTLALGIGPLASCQVFQVAAGASTLYQAQGGSIQMRGANNNATLGLGIIDGHLTAGGSWTRSVRGSLYTAGSQAIPCDLPTDIFSPGHSIYALGGSVGGRLRGTDVFAFGGATSTNAGTPFFQGQQVQTPTGVLLIKRRLATNLLATSEVIVSRRTSALASLAWVPSPRWVIAASGGTGDSQPYGAFSLIATYPRVEIMASYLLVGSQLRRATVAGVSASEPYRDNVQITLRPLRSFTFSAGHQNFLQPAFGTAAALSTSVTQASASLRLAGVDLSAAIFRSTYGDAANQSRAFSAHRRLGERITLAGSYLENRARGGSSSVDLLANGGITLTSRWTLNQIVNRSNGQTSVGFGGSFLSNILTLSADYETYYVPSRIDRPFEQAMILNAQLYSPGGLGFHGATFVGPTGQLLYTADANAIASRTPHIRDTTSHAAMGAMLLHARVLEVGGHPVMGAALLIDQVPVFTGPDGSFSLRERRSRTHSLTVLTAQFMDGGSYRVVYAPATIQSCINGADPEITIVVASTREERMQ